MEHKGTLLHSKAPPSGPYPEPDRCSPCPFIPLFEICLNISSPLGLDLPSGWYPNVGWSTQCSNLHSDTTLLQPNRTNTPVNTETEQYTHIQSSAPEDECSNIRNMLSNKKLSYSDIKLVQFILIVVYIAYIEKGR